MRFQTKNQAIENFGPNLNWIKKLQIFPWVPIDCFLFFFFCPSGSSFSGSRQNFNKQNNLLHVFRLIVVCQALVVYMNYYELPPFIWIYNHFVLVLLPRRHVISIRSQLNVLHMFRYEYVSIVFALPLLLLLPLFIYISCWNKRQFNISKYNLFSWTQRCCFESDTRSHQISFTCSMYNRHTEPPVYVCRNSLNVCSILEYNMLIQLIFH